MANDRKGSGSGSGSGSSSGSGSGGGSGGGSGSGDDSRDRDRDRDRDDSDGDSGSGLVGDALKKILTAGVSAAFMTEESIRSFLGGVNIPKETINVLLAGASKSKEELMNRVGKEVIGIVSKIDFVKEASRFVEEHKFRINAEVEVIRKDKTGPEKD